MGKSVSTGVPPTALALGEQIALMGEVAYLLSHSPFHLGYMIADLMRFFMHPIRLNQYRIYRTRQRPVGFTTWAYLSSDVAQRYATGTYELRKDDWRSGRELWFIEFVAPFGHVHRIVDDLRSNAFVDAHAWFLRRRGKAARVVEIWGTKHPRAAGAAAPLVDQS